MVAAPWLQLGCEGRPHHAGPRRLGHHVRPSALRLDLEPDRQHRRAHGLRRSAQHHRAALQPEPERLQADQRDRGSRRELRARSHRPELQVPPGLAHQPGPGQEAPLEHGGHRRIPLQQGCQRRLLHQRQPDRAQLELHRRRQPSTLDHGVMQRRPAQFRDQLRQPHLRQRGERGGPEEPERGQVVARLGVAREGVQGRFRQGRLFLRRSEEHRGRGFDRVRIVERQRAVEQPQHPGTRLRRQLPRAPRLRHRILQP